MDRLEQHQQRVRRAVGGDAVALTALLTETRRPLCERIARRIPADLRDSVDADDIAQEAHVEVFRHIAGFENRESNSFERWVATIALRKLRDAVRARRADRRGGGARQIRAVPGNVEDSMIALLDVLAGPDRTPSQSVARHEVVAAVKAALDALPADYRDAVWMVNIEGRSVADAAVAMGRTERAVHNLCYKAKDRMRELLGSGSRFLSSSG